MCSHESNRKVNVFAMTYCMDLRSYLDLYGIDTIYTLKGEFRYAWKDNLRVLKKKLKRKKLNKLKKKCNTLNIESNLHNSKPTQVNEINHNLTKAQKQADSYNIESENCNL